MIFSLFSFTLLTGLLLLALGALFIRGGAGWQRALERFPRSELAAYLTMGLGGAWFLYKVWNLAPADELFGPSTRLVLFAVFGITWAGSFFVVKDFLAVRGLSVLVLLLAATGLETAYMRFEVPSRLFLVSLIYALVVLAIYLGVSPFRWRDFVGWLFRRPTRPRVLGTLLAGYGLLLTVVAFMY